MKWVPHLRRVMILAPLMAAACATTPIREVETRDVVVTRTERAITEQQVRDAPPPAQLPPRGSTPLSALLDIAVAQVCAWVAWGHKVDPLLQHSAGMPVTPRIVEPVCEDRD